MNKSNVAETEAMYADYKSGLSCAEVGKKWHYNAETIWKRFKVAGYVLRPSNKSIHMAGSSDEMITPAVENAEGVA